MDQFLSLLQFTDGLFPAGAYAHSFGLEAYVQSGEVRDAAGVEAFLRAYLEGCAGPTDAVALVCARRAAANENLASCLALDEMLDAMKAPSELRDASRQMGRQTLRVSTHLPCHPMLEEFGKAVAEEITPGHHPIVFGMIGGILGWDARRNDWRVSLFDERGSGWRGAAALAARPAFGTAHRVECEAAHRNACGRSAAKK